MALKFGTSGIRGLVTEMTDLECWLYTKAFVQYVKEKTDVASVCLAGDYRASTPRILSAAARAIRDEGLHVDFCGYIPTSAIMNYGVRNNMASIMVTGSHIPEDRNGIKFNMPWGEVLKADEGEISARYSDLKTRELGEPAVDKDELEEINNTARDAYCERYTQFFPAGCLSGLKVVFYQHSAVGRDLLPNILKELGAETILVGWSETFVPVDTEAVQEPDRLAAWVAEHEADALVSTDGDSDRPLVVDDQGKVLRGDVLGILVSHFLGADAVSTPVSCNTALEKSGWFEKVSRTRIGSPYVIEAMNEAIDAGCKTVAGYEANGGFLTGTDIFNTDTGTVLPALPTRDAALPIIAVLLAAKRNGGTLSELTSELPPRFTASGLLREFPNELGATLVGRFETEGIDFANELFSPSFGAVDSIDFTDGVRMTFSSGEIVHLRPSGNAPEFRCYTESDTEEQAERNNGIALGVVAELKNG